MHVDFAFGKSVRQKYRICGILPSADTRTRVSGEGASSFSPEDSPVTISHGSFP
mgnify:CR=1 FL=1